MLKLITADEVGHRMTSLDADLLLLVALVAFVIWILVTMWRYAAIQSRKGMVEQEQDLFGRPLRPESRRFMAVVVPRAVGPLPFFVCVVIAVLLGLSKVLGYF